MIIGILLGWLEPFSMIKFDVWGRSMEEGGTAMVDGCTMVSYLISFGWYGSIKTTMGSFA